MIIKTKTHACKRRLLSGAGVALALTLAALPAHAQAISGRAAGDTVLTNAQSAPAGMTLAEGNGATVEVVVAGPVAGSTVALDHNAMTAGARTNSASLTLAPDPAAVPASRPTVLAAGSAAINAQANTLIANQQSVGSGEAIADIFVSPISISAGNVLAGFLKLTDNQQTASAAGNAANAAITAMGAGGDGAGIVSTQISGSGSGVAARVRRDITIDTGALSQSDLVISGNRNDSDAASNAVDSELFVSGGAIDAAAQASFASTVPAIGVGGPQVSTTFGVVSDQQTAAVVKARAGNLVDGFPDGGPAIRASIDGDASDASIVSDGNEVSANADGNRSANRLSLSAPTISSAPSGNGAIGSVTNVQAAAGARIVASAHGGVAAEVTGHLADSNLSISQNERQTRATGNDATDNRLTVDAATAASPSGTASNDAALVGPEGDAVADAGFSLQNVQDYATSSISTVQAGPAARADVGGTLLGSTIAMTGNSVAGAGIGNSAVNSVQLSVTTLSTSAALNNVQSGNGSVTSDLGTAADPDGMLIAPAASITGSNLTVSGNDTTGSAIGNAASNALGVTATTIQGDGVTTTTGVVGADYGATGTLVVANNQKLGQMSLDGSLTPTISSNVVSISGIDSAGAVTGSTMQVADNSQRAEALGNSAGNRLTLSAATLDDAGAALSSSQYGQANVAATSDFALGARGDFAGSAASLSGNSNVALAVVNDASSALEADAASGTGLTSAFVSAGPLGPPLARGTMALASQQFATGSAQASAVSHIGDVAPVEGLTGSRFTVEGDTTVAESAGNRVTNALGVDATGSDGPSAGLANSQTNMAQVGASVIARAGYALIAPAVGPVSGSAIDIGGNTTSALARGNAADNAMTVSSIGGSGGTASADLRNEAVQGGTVLLNGQANYGTVAASTDGSGYLVPLNAGGTVSASTVAIGGNAIGASAYGNSASNTIALSPGGAAPGAGIANFQTNYGGVTALVSGTAFQAATGPLSGSALRISGNNLAATAVGNQASSVIASPR